MSPVGGTLGGYARIAGEAGGARAKSGVVSAVVVAGAQEQREDVQSKYRAKLVELYEKHNPGNVARVDYLLKKYRGQEEFLYRSVAAKYSKPGEAASLGSATTPASSSSSSAAIAAALPRGREAAGLPDVVSSTTRPKAAPPRPPPPPPPVHFGAAGPGGDAGKAWANGGGSVARAAPPSLSQIDFLIVGIHTGFFDHQTGAGESSGSSSSGSEGSEVSSSGEEHEVAIAEGVGPPRAKPSTAISVPAAAALDAKARAAAVERPTGGKAAGEDSDMSDDDLADALAAKLRAASAGKRAGLGAGATTEVSHLDPTIGATAKASPARRPVARECGPDQGIGTQRERRGARGEAGRHDDDVGLRVRSDREGGMTMMLACESAAIGKEASAARSQGIAVTAKEEPLPDEEESDSQVVSLFDVWLACLKFLVGWNEAQAQDGEQVKAALKEHLREEGIESTRAADQLCATIVPLLLDVRRIDAAVVKNIKTQVIRGLKTVQVSILRVVAFELCRERDAKLLFRKRKAEGSKAAADLSTGGAPYLASDISSIAKVCQHFRFDKVFNGGLHQLITSIRKQGQALANGIGKNGRSAKEAGAGPSEDATSNKRKAASGGGVKGAIPRKTARVEAA